MKLGRSALFLYCLTSLVLGAPSVVQNSPFTQLSLDPFTHSLQLWKQSHTLQKAIKTKSSDLVKAIYSAGFKAVSSNGDEDILFLIHEARFTMSLGDIFIKGGAYSHLLTPPPLVLKPFSTLGSYQQTLQNTSNVSISWQNDTPADIAYQQLLKQQNEEWVIVSMNIDNTVASLNISDGAGTYVIRKILRSHDYIDSDGESSLGDLSNPARAKVISFDITPPDFVSGCVVSFINSCYHWHFTLAEQVQIELTIKTNDDKPYYHLSQMAQAGPCDLFWNGENPKGNRSDGRYTYELTLMDLLGNRSPPSMKQAKRARSPSLSLPI